MAVWLVVTFHATPGKGAELAQAMQARCEISRQDAGCEQFEAFQSVFDPDKLVLLELWKDQAALPSGCRTGWLPCQISVLDR
jgi:quinol monooxygenase YgiN